MFQQLRPALRMMILLTVVTGLVYPGVVAGICQLFFHESANGNLIKKGGQIVGSTLIGQNFSRPEYFHPRPSAAGNGYDPTQSGGSNLGPTSQKLFNHVKVATEQFRKENPDYTGPVPADAVTSSGSGLDPDISLANAMAQAARVAKARHLSLSTVNHLIALNTASREFGFLGEPRVNVLGLNLQLDKQANQH